MQSDQQVQRPWGRNEPGSQTEAGAVEGWVQGPKAKIKRLCFILSPVGSRGAHDQMWALRGSPLLLWIGEKVRAGAERRVGSL